MEENEPKTPWWCSVSLRISHADLDPAEVSRILDTTPQIAQRPGESKVPHGACTSAGYWCVSHRVDYPDRPDSVFLWAESFVRERESTLRQMLGDGCDVNVYIGVFTNILALGFNVPPTPTIWKLAIPVGVEFFSR